MTFAFIGIGGGGCAVATFYAFAAMGLLGLVLVLPGLAWAALQLSGENWSDVMVNRVGLTIAATIALFIPVAGVIIAMG